MNEHTPGPWKTYPNNGMVLDGVRYRVVWPENGHLDLAYVPANGTDDNGNANARLIAAAPDLLASCKDILRVIEWGDDRRPSREGRLTKDLRAAIAKAEGT